MKYFSTPAQFLRQDLWKRVVLPLFIRICTVVVANVLERDDSSLQFTGKSIALPFRVSCAKIKADQPLTAAHLLILTPKPGRPS